MSAQHERNRELSIVTNGNTLVTIVSLISGGINFAGFSENLRQGYVHVISRPMILSIQYVIYYCTSMYM